MTAMSMTAGVLTACAFPPLGMAAALPRTSAPGALGVPVVSAIVYGAAAVLLIAGVFAGMQWLLARIYGERLDGGEDPEPIREKTTSAKR